MPSDFLAAGCRCTAPVMLLDGRVACAKCGAGVVCARCGTGHALGHVAGHAVANDVVYSTLPTAWPPGCRTRRAARDRIHAVPGHRREGRGRATVWSVAVDAYRAHYARRPSSRRALAPVASTDEDAAEAAIVAAGLRMTKAQVA